MRYEHLSIAEREKILFCIASKFSITATAEYIGRNKDRGKEFSLHSEITKVLGVEFYFPPPHHPWERGTNENTNVYFVSIFRKVKI